MPEPRYFPQAIADSRFDLPPPHLSPPGWQIVHARSLPQVAPNANDPAQPRRIYNWRRRVIQNV